MSKNTNFKPFLAYSASAGSGKTFALAVRYISLLFMGESPSTILAATFTNKAAGEMQERVVNSLRNLGEDEAFLQAIVDETGLSREALFKKQPEVLKRFLSSASYIVTLDSFFSMILRSASLEIGLEPDFVTKEETQEELEKHFLDELDEKGMLSSLVNLAMDIEDKRFKKIFDLMAQFYKVDPLLPKPTEVTLSMSKEEEACEILRLEMLKALQDAGAPQRCLGQFDTKSTKELFGKKLFEKERLGEHSWFKKVANEKIEAVFTALKQRLLLWAKAKEMIVLHHIFSIYDYYRNAIISHAKSTGVLTFDDLTYFTYRLLHESLSKEFLYFKIDAKFKHILLDEFQDTSTLQFLLLKPLIDEIFAGEGQSQLRSFFYVGDTKQSLYRFRGGVEELFDKIAEYYGIEIAQMDTNYRSSKNVVEQVNRWFIDMMEGYVPQKSRNGASEGYVEVLESEEVIDEAVAQAQRLIEMGVDVDDIAFLVSTNKDGQTLQEACEAASIPTLLKTSSSLRHLPKAAAVVAMVSYLFGGTRIDAEAMLQKVGFALDEVDLSWFSVFMSPLQVVDRLIREFGYFDSDPNMLKLLEFASNFEDIPTFIEEFESSNIPLASHSVHGVNIMTIHGSKGLEFHHVIVVDKLTRPNADKYPLIFHYNDDLYIDRILYRTANREHFDRDYARIMEERKASALKDRKNVLYVALTRAVEGLIVVKKPEGSIFDEIDISPLKIGEIRRQGAGSREQGVEEVKSDKIVLSYYGKQEVPEPKEDEDEKDMAAILFGTALHYGLEMMGSFNETGLQAAMTAVRNRYGQQISADALYQIEKRIGRLISDSMFQSLLKGAQIRKEQSLFYEGEMKQIDLLLEHDEYMIVVDYKSSRKFHMAHQQQVSGYVKAIEKISGKPTSGRLVYLLEEEIAIENLK